MTKLPRRRIEPLDPAPDAFDRVLTGARRRRRRTALLVASSSLAIAVVAAGSFALGSSLNATHRLEQAAAGNGDKAPTAAASSPTAATASSGHPRATHSRASQTRPATAQTISRLRGRAVDPNGRGLAGLYVLPGRPNHLTFTAAGKSGGRTDAQGYYDIPCPRAPVLLATWKLNSNVAAVSTGGTWAPTFVEGSTKKPVVPSCGATTHTTTMGIGASLRGTVRVTGVCAPGTTFPVSVWLNGDRRETVRLVGLRDGDRFTFAGLPAGTHTLGARGATTPITVLGGASRDQDAVLTCADGVTPGGPTGSSSPTASLTPSPSPSATPTTPTPTPITPTPTPSPTIS